MYAKELSIISSMLSSNRKAIDEGLPSLAECGGYMYLHEKMEGMDKKFYDMIGLIPGKVFNAKKLVRFGYIEVGETSADHHEFIGENQVIKGHEFHYYDSTATSQGGQATKPTSRLSWICNDVSSTHFWGFPHLYYPSNEQFVQNFLNKTIKYRNS